MCYYELNNDLLSFLAEEKYKKYWVVIINE